MRRVKLTTAVKTDSPYVVGDIGDILNLPDYAAFFVTSQNLGEYYGPAPEPGPSRAELEQQEKEVQANVQAIATAGTMQKMQFPGEEAKSSEPAVNDPDAVPENASPKRPYGNAPKSAWQRYACSVDSGLTPERAETMTKADLMSRYGERL